jgi:uracil-DNA glycosylase
VEELRAAAGPEGASIPDFDPWDGGIHAQVLFLLEAPGSKAVASGFISRNNPDETAKNFFELNRDAGIPRKRTVTWNVVPWYIGDGARIRAAKRQDVSTGTASLERLLTLLPSVRVIVLVGKKAQQASSLISRLRSDVRVFNSPHPSPLFINNAPGNREQILTVLREVAAYLGVSRSVG